MSNLPDEHGPEQRHIWAAFVRSVAGDLGPQAITNAIRERHGSGPSQPSIGRWLRGEHLPKPNEAATFARAFGADVLTAFVAAGYLTDDEARAGLSADSIALLRRLGAN